MAVVVPVGGLALVHHTFVDTSVLNAVRERSA
jgi:hypothetical protein